MRLLKFETLASTNQYCKLLDLTETEEFTIIVASEQTAGKGQQGNRWDSERGKNLTFSIVLKPTFMDPARQYELTKALALGVSDVVGRKIGKGKEVRIKWPNDIYVGMRKICGILVENHIGRRFESAVCGIGINVNQQQFAEWVPNPTSLSLETGQPYDLEPLLEETVAAIADRYDALRRGKEQEIDEAYLKRLLCYGVAHRYQYHGEEVEATITGVGRWGHLELTSSNGEKMSCGMKEIVMMR